MTNQDVSLTKVTYQGLSTGTFRASAREFHNYPSEASIITPKGLIGKCQRAIYYRWRGITPTDPISEKSMTKMGLGKASELMLVDNWKRMGILAGNSVKFLEPSVQLSGELDAVLNINEKLTGVEIKSYAGYFASKLIEGKGGTPEPRDHELLQAFVYTWLFREELDQFKILYISRESGNITTFNLGIEEQEGKHYCTIGLEGMESQRYSDDVHIEGIFERYQRNLINSTKDEEPPRDYKFKYTDEEIETKFRTGELSKSKYKDFLKDRRNNRPGDWHCVYCNLKTYCWRSALSDPNFDWSIGVSRQPKLI